MLEDEEWQLPDTERARVHPALAYFCEPCDLIPDHVTALGFLDDAIMVELVVEELRHELEAYDDFCRFRTEELARRTADTGSDRPGSAQPARCHACGTQAHARARPRLRGLPPCSSS
jgi:hypothetical protein